MEASITLSQLLEVLGVLVAVWGAYKVVIEIVERINTKHDQVQKWDEYDKQIKDIKKEQEMITMCMSAVLDGLHQLKCNGEVTKASNKLNEYLNAKAHEV